MYNIKFGELKGLWNSKSSIVNPGIRRNFTVSKIFNDGLKSYVKSTVRIQNQQCNRSLFSKNNVATQLIGPDNRKRNWKFLVRCHSIYNADNLAACREKVANGDVHEKTDEYGMNPNNKLCEEFRNSEKSNVNKYCSRSHTCGELNDTHIGEKVLLMGWVEYIRMGKFIVLRDAYGKVQLCVPESLTDLQKKLNSITPESVISAEGYVKIRPFGKKNEKYSNQKIEVELTDLNVLNKAKIKIPFRIGAYNKPNEAFRMKYRYLDLRYQYLQHNLRLRSNILHKMRRFLIEQLNFVEVETPTLFKRTPGGAQEFIVPTRDKGKFYSLVQSPQQFKQLLMVGSVDRYFQVARCYRDESTRNDRQPEFTQLDIEMSFCERDDILNLTEDVLKYSWPDNMDPLVTPFPRLTFNEAMNNYGTDKPDLRFDWKKNYCLGKFALDDYFLLDDFSVYGFVARKGGIHSSDDVIKMIQNKITFYSAKISFLFFNNKSNEEVGKNLESLFNKVVAEHIKEITKYKQGDALFLAVGERNDVRKYLGEMRIQFADFLEENGCEAVRSDGFNFSWILDFPLFELNHNTLRPSHHPFTQPHPEDIDLCMKNPLQARGLNYDLVLNGNEVGGGSIRIKDFTLQKIVLDKILKINSTVISHLLEALECGAPPHGGIALGLDRLIAIICKAQSIRDVIAFPKNHFGGDTMSGAPSSITEDERKLYHI